MRQLLHVITYAENNPANGLLQNEQYYKYSCNLVRSFMDRANARIKSTPLVTLADSLAPGISLVAHPLLPNQYWRNSVVHLLDHVS
jgi:hypothetical protein